MARKLFVNLAVTDVKVSTDFFTALGFEFNAQFSDDRTACMVLSGEASVMLLETDRFRDFTTKAVVDSTEQTETILCVSADSRDEVDHLVGTAIANGGKPANDPMDHGFMYGWSFQDPDGHLWEVMWMDPAAAAG